MSASRPLGGCVCGGDLRGSCPVHDRPRGEKLERKDDDDRPAIGLTGEVRPPDGEP
ncbi:hypothetical protein AVJ28_gp68 [Mycobacterium phage Baee]|uniref:Uncharacterized protein n=1 Tax=Mycobacterium phage Baee TaxID=1647306 RepID=A0A0F6SJQ7_9CAUD|nr:hypothetical protein AVJ28_gp68 [Mycobacterium phage Baee]AKF14637.1 hypothetical protein SEA_BAEE_68 [Mycobacterium phage Baee]